MYYIAGALVTACIILYFISRSRDGPMYRKGIMGVLDRISFGILLVKEKIVSRKRDGNLLDPGAPKGITSSLEQLNPGDNIPELYREYVVGKISLSLAVIIVGAVLAAGLKYKSDSSAGELADGTITREDFAGDPISVDLEASIDDSGDPISLQLNPKSLTDEEIEVILPEFYDLLGKKLLAGNKSFDQITEDVDLVSSVKGYPFSVEWSSSDTGLVAAGSGAVTEVDSECQVILKASVRYMESVFEKEFFLTLKPRDYSGSKEIHYALEKLLKDSEEASRESRIWKIPEEYEGQPIEWKKSVKDYSAFVFAGVLAVGMIIFVMSDKDLAAKVEEKKKKMKRAYPDVIEKMILYIGAGMTVRAAFFKIASGGAPDDNPIYSEMIFTCRELKSGISEEEGYERFGKRTGLQEYIRMAGLLGQNLKKGSADLLSRLRAEADSAVAEKMQNCRKLGEEAVTKLLLPMVLMLLVVMIMILLPAFTSMNL